MLKRVVAFCLLGVAAGSKVTLSALEAEELPQDIELSKVDESALYQQYEKIFEGFSKSLNVEIPKVDESSVPPMKEEAFSLLARDMLERPSSIKPESFMQKATFSMNHEDVLFENLATNKETLGGSLMKSHIRQNVDNVDIGTATTNLGSSSLPVDVIQLLRAEADGTEAEMPAQVVDRAIEECKGLMAGITAKVDRLVLYWCMPRDIYLRELFQSQVFEMVRLAGEYRSEVGLRQKAMDEIYQVKGARDAVLTDMGEKQKQFWSESTRLKQQIKTGTETMLVKKVLHDATDPNTKAKQFLQNGKNTLYKLCPKNSTEHAVHDIDVEDSGDSREEEDEDAPINGMEFVLLDPHIISEMKKLPEEAQGHLKQALGSVPETGLLEVEEWKMRQQPTQPTKKKSSKSSNRCLADRGGGQMKMLHDRTSKMLGKEQDKLDKLNEELAETESSFNKDRRRFTNTLNGLKRQEGSHRGDVNDAETVLLQIWKDYRQVANMAWRIWWWMWWTRYWCRYQLRQYVHVELCSLLKIRDNIVSKYKKVDALTAVVDCQVTPWRGGQCSKTCAGGKREIYRVVDTQANNYGAFCPRLKARMTCNNFPCPIDCGVSPWSEFDACSVKCGEGTKSRMRTVTLNNKHRGKQCPQLVDTQPCQMKPCDVDCQLGGWTGYSGCSRACRGRAWWWGSGRKYSVRKVTVKRKGNGRKCASRYSPVRIRSRKCNAFSCPRGILKCKAKQDIIFAVDESGSIRPWGADALKAFVQELTSRYITAEWSSYWTWNNSTRVKKWKWRRFNKVGLMTFSKVATVQTPLTYYRDKIAGAVTKMQWDGVGTQTHLAVRKSLAMFKTGRAKAQSVLMILTDSEPDRNFMMAKDVEAAKKTGVRIIIIYFGWRRAWSLKKYVSFPPRDNFIRIWSTWAIRYWWTRRWYSNRLVRITCPVVSPLPPRLRWFRR